MRAPLSDYEAFLTKAYSAFNARDLDGALALMHPDVVWANGMEGGFVHGREGVRAYWARQWGMIDPHVEPTRCHVDDDGTIVIHVHAVVRDLEGNTIVDQMVQHAYTIRDGLILRMEIRET